MPYLKSTHISPSQKSYGQHGTHGGETILSQQVPYPNKFPHAHAKTNSTLTGIMSFVMHEFVYFGRSIPWIIIDALPYFRHWKLQDVHSPFIRGAILTM